MAHVVIFVCVKIQLQRVICYSSTYNEDFYDIIFEIKHKLYI